MLEGNGRTGVAGRGRARSGRTGSRRARLSLIVMTLALAAIVLGGTTALAGGSAPTVETEKPGPAGIGRTSLALLGTVNPNSSNVSECYFEYGSSESSLEDRASCSYLPGEGETPVPVTASVSGLAESTTYYFRLHAVSGEGASTGGTRQATTLPNAPNTNTEPANPVGRTSATLNAYVNPDGSEVAECEFEWGQSPESLTNRAECSSPPGEGSLPVAVHATIGGLSESSTYYYRVMARNAYGYTHGGRANLETRPSAPSVNVEYAVSVTHTSAVLKGSLNPDGAKVEACYFEWGTSGPDEHRAPCEPAEPGSGEAPVQVTAQLSGLAEGASYRFRLVSGNAHGTSTSGALGFSTPPNVPKLFIGRPRELSDRSALLTAKVDPQDEQITGCTFEYGTTPALGGKVPCTTLPPQDERYSPVSALATGLSATTTYFYRLRAVDASGITYSREETLTTYAAGLLPTIRKISPRKGSSGGGTTVTIKGENLLDTAAVSFGEGETTDILSDSADTVVVVAPPGVGTVDVVVRTGNGESEIVPADLYAYGKPIVTSVTPGHGPLGGGTPVTVTGNGFEPGTTGTTFIFGKANATAVECTSSTTCTMLTPARSKAGTAKIQAIVASHKSSVSPGGTFSYES